MSHDLRELQAFFASVIQNPTAVQAQADAASPTARFVAGSRRLSPSAQLEVYREQFWLRHVGALQEDFVTLHHLLGQDGFHSLAERYLAAHPPADFSLRDLGARLPAFLARTAPYAADALLVDCARIEWAFVEAFDAADAGPLDTAAIASVPEDAWAGARLAFHPSVQCVALAHHAHDYRASVRAGRNPPRPSREPAFVVVYRGPESLQYVDIEPLAFELLERLRRRETLGDACEALASGASDAAALEAKVGGWFQAWAAYGWLSAIETPRIEG